MSVLIFSVPDPLDAASPLVAIAQKLVMLVRKRKHEVLVLRDEQERKFARARRSFGRMGT